MAPVLPQLVTRIKLHIRIGCDKLSSNHGDEIPACLSGGVSDVRKDCLGAIT